MPLKAVLTFVMCFGALSAASWRNHKVDQHGNATENFSSSGLRLYISSQKLRFAKNEDITFSVSLVNEGAYPITIYLHENPLKNFTIIARDLDGRSLNVKEEMYFRGPEDWRDPHHTRYTGEAYPMRKMIIHAGEKYEKRIRLADYVEWESFSEKLKDLRITAHFYPNPLQAERLFLPSQTSLRLIYDQSREVLPERDNAGDASTELPAVSAREIVYLMLSAEYTKNWSQYFKYVSLKDIIRDYPEFSRLYADDSSESRAQALSEFRKFLAGRGSHKLIRFRVLGGESKESGTTAQVRVRARRDVEGFERDYLTTYYLTKRDALWQITGVESRLAN
ncbi:MAG: hypothetical protein JNJ69_16830 [Leptospiraceae bacterium]|nr:hypothetical protein [Leptospiraceae bacterium]